MAKGQHLTRHQQGIVKRYYDNLDTISLQKLSELVSELYLCTDAKKADRLWLTAETALRKVIKDPRKVDPIINARDVKALAALVNTLSGGR